MANGQLSWPSIATRPRIRWLPTNNPKGLLILNNEFSTDEYNRPGQEVQYIISGDKHLFGLGEQKGAIILPPAAFMMLIEKKGL